jgi:hypothetical protein
MLFKFPKKKLVIDCFTSDELVLQTSPITNAIRHIPEWWKNLPPTYNIDFYKNATMKSCIGMLDYYKKSIALPLWSDLAIEVKGKDYKWQFSDQNSMAHIHQLDKQAAGFVPNHGHLKLEPPWMIKTKEQISWVWSQPLYSYPEELLDIKLVPACVDISVTMKPNINIIFPLNQNRVYELKFGQPLVHLTPMTDRDIKVVRHLVDQQEFNRLNNMQSRVTFSKTYFTAANRKKKFSDCPYHKELDKNAN